MTPRPGRSVAGVDASVGILVALLAVALLVASCSPTPRLSPASTQDVAALTSAPTSRPTPSPSPRGSPAASAKPAASPSTPGPSGEPAGDSAIVPGAVDRSSLDVSATYRVNAAITVRTGALDVTTLIEARNDSGAGIDRLELNTIAARLGHIRIVTASVDETPVKVRVRDQTLRVPLGGVLPDGATAAIRITYRATLRAGVGGSDWMLTRAGGTLALYRWIPWISRAMPFDRPNQGDPFVTPSSPRVEVEILTDRPMVLAGPAVNMEEFAAGAGRDWSFAVHDVRDVSVVLAPDFHVAHGDANGIPIRAFTRPGGLSGEQLVAQAAAALATEAELVGVAYPWTVLSVVETRGGYGLESPGLVWIPVNANSLNRTYLVYHETAHQWFYGLVGNDQQAEPFADEGPADLLARSALGTIRGSRCARDVLDKPITRYSLVCYYETVYVQGGGVLDDIRHQMGTKRFWDAMGAYLEDNRFEMSGTRQLLEALRAASPVNLLPILRARFPDLY